MSSFKGRMRLYTNICIDRFDGVNLKCTAFFLSHCHKDHMAGLDDEKFEAALRARSDVFLYCTEITCLLLLADEEYKCLEEFIKVLEVGTAHLIRVPRDHVERGGCMVTVTPISAGHCPGSAMFLFEGDEGTCLYTGDFRWEPSYASKVSAFGPPERLKEINHLYIDTTFCVPAALHIPSRVECADATVSVVASWLKRSPLHQVAFFCPARYGYEFLFRELATRLDIKIHVSKLKYELYEQIPDLSGLFTDDPTKARVHACFPKLRSNCSSCPPCLSKRLPEAKTEGKPGKQFEMLNIRPCAMWFTTKAGRAALEQLPPASPRGLQRVCYSMHSSYSEIQDLVSYLQPRHVWPNVIPASDHTSEQVQSRLNSFLEKSHPLRPKTTTAERIEPQTSMKTLDLTSARPPPAPLLFRFVPHDSDSSDGCVFDSPEQADHAPSEVTHPKPSPSPAAPVVDSLEQDLGQLPVSCDGWGGEEAEADLHLRLSQASDDSEDSHASDDTVEDAECPETTSEHGQCTSDAAKSMCHLDSTMATELRVNNTPEHKLRCDTPKSAQHTDSTLKSWQHTGSPSAENSQLRENSVTLPTQGLRVTMSDRSQCSRKNDRQLCSSHHSSEQQELNISQHNEPSVISYRISSHASGLDNETEKEIYAGKVLIDEEEEDSEVVDSSPVSAKKFTSLLKGRPGKIGPSAASTNKLVRNLPCSLTLECGSAEPHETSTKKRDDTKSAGNGSKVLGPSKSTRHLDESMESRRMVAKRLKLSPGSESTNQMSSSSCGNDQQVKHLPKPRSERTRNDKGNNEQFVQDVCIVLSDSEETDEDSEKLLKNRNAPGPWLGKKRKQFIDLTQDK